MSAFNLLHLAGIDFTAARGGWFRRLPSA